MTKNHDVTSPHQTNKHKATSNKDILLGEGPEHGERPSLWHNVKGKHKTEYGTDI